MGRFDEIVRSQFGLLTRTQALDLFGRGSFERRVQNGALIRVVTGLYRVAGAPITPEQELFGATMVYRGYAGFRASAALHGFDRYRSLRLELVAPHGPGRTRRDDARDVVVHRSNFLPASHLEVVRGIPATTAARTACDLSALLGIRSFGKLVDDAVRRSVVAYEDVANCRNELRARGRRRTTILDEFLELRGFGFDPGGSDPELRLGDWLDAARLAPQRQVSVIVSGERRVLDYAYPEYKVAVEYLGIEPHSQPSRVVDDSRRTTELQLAGWLVVLITKANSRRDAIRMVREALEQRGWTP